MARRCVYGCRSHMVTERREGESDLEYFDRDRRVYNGHDYDCPGHEASRRAWSLRVYGVEDTAQAEEIEQTVVVTLELRCDASFYKKAKLREVFRNMARDAQFRGLPIGITGGGGSYRVRSVALKGVRF